MSTDTDLVGESDAGPREQAGAGPDSGETSASVWRDWSPDRLARAALSAVTDMADPRLARLVAQQGPDAVWQSLRGSGREGPWFRKAAMLDLSAVLDASACHRLRFVVPGDREWPDPLEALVEARVGDLGGAPQGLWLRGGGDLADLTTGAVAIVGARASTPYGDHVASDLGHDLGRRDRTVISGGAYGIDAAGHRGALSADGLTVAVLACGLDRAYPVAHTGLFAQIERAGLLVSEYPVGVTPTKRAFLARNRLIAALSEATVIVEAAARSGARNTVAWAHACARPVLAVPGPITAAMSVTPHRLIRDNEAVLISDIDDLVSVLAPMGQSPLLESGGQTRRLDAVPPHLMVVREVLPGRGGATIAEVASASGLPVPRCLASLAELEELGLAESNASGGWHAVRP